MSIEAANQPLPFKGGAGGGEVRRGSTDEGVSDTPHPNPSPEPQASEAQREGLRNLAFRALGSAPKSQGFTLFELMVALAIFGLIAAAGVAVLGTTVRTQQSVAIKLDGVAADQRLGTLMAMDLAQALPRVTRNAEGASRRVFAAGENGVMLGLVRAAGATGGEGVRPGVQRIEWRFAGGRIRRAVSAMPDGSVMGEGSLLADQVQDVTLRFRDKGEWRDRWDPVQPDAMPQAVELTVKRRNSAPVRRLFLVGPGR